MSGPGRAAGGTHVTPWSSLRWAQAIPAACRVGVGAPNRNQPHPVLVSIMSRGGCSGADLGPGGCANDAHPQPKPKRESPACSALCLQWYLRELHGGGACHQHGWWPGPKTDATSATRRTSEPGPGSPLQHPGLGSLCHACITSRLGLPAPPTSASGLGARLPHMHQDRTAFSRT